MKAKLRKAAERIAALEKKCQEGENIEQNMKEMSDIYENFSLDELAEIDNYITEKGLLTE